MELGKPLLKANESCHVVTPHDRYKKQTVKYQHPTPAAIIMTPILQTKTPLHFLNPNKDALVAEFVGKPLNALRTPAFVVDRAVFADKR